MIGHQAQRRIKKFTTRELEKIEEVEDQEAKGREAEGIVEYEGVAEAENQEKKKEAGDRAGGQSFDMIYLGNFRPKVKP